MLVLSLVSTFLVLWSLGTPAVVAGVDALVVAAVATLVEAVSVKGLDNITVPLISALVLWLLMGA